MVQADWYESIWITTDEQYTNWLPKTWADKNIYEP